MPQPIRMIVGAASALLLAAAIPALVEAGATSGLVVYVGFVVVNLLVLAGLLTDHPAAAFLPGQAWLVAIGLVAGLLVVLASLRGLPPHAPTAGVLGTLILLLQAAPDRGLPEAPGHRLLAAGVIMVGVAAIALLVAQGMYARPVMNDSSVSLYTGQHLLRGGIPYQTIFYLHPPLRFFNSAVRVSLADLTGVPYVAFSRSVDMLLIVIIMLLSAGIAVAWRQGQPGAGLIAVVALLAVDTLVPVGLPNEKVTIGAVTMAAVWLLQRRLWVAAGIATACAGMLWLPASALGLVGLAVAFFDDQQERWQAMLRVALGGGSVLLILGVYLLTIGSVAAFWQQVVQGAFGFATPGLVATGGPQAQQTFVGYLGELTELVRGDLLLGVLFLVGMITGGVQAVRQRSAEQMAPVLSWLVLFGLFSIDYQARGDNIIWLRLVTAAMGAGAAAIISWVASTQAKQWWASVVLAALLFGYGLHDWRPFPPAEPPTYADRVAMAEGLAPLLAEDDDIMAVQNLWLHVHLGRDTAMPVIQLGDKAVASLAGAGISWEWVAARLNQEQPVLLLVANGPLRQLEEAGLTVDYTYIGDMTVAGVTNPQRVLVRSDRPELADHIRATWLLEE
ncbi:MAG: hypothetical protein ACFB51_03620 [Anaerolineae bacterium]